LCLSKQTQKIFTKKSLGLWMVVGTGMQIPAAAASVLNQSHQPPVTTAAGPAVAPQSVPPITTQCFMLTNMFDAKTR